MNLIIQNKKIKYPKKTNMKKINTQKILLGLGLSFLGLFAQAQNGLEKIIVEKYYISNADDAAASIGTLPVGSVTYRIFVDMLPGYTFQMAYGNANHTLKIATTTSFFNNEDRGAIKPSYTKTQAKNNTVMLDSWISIGAGCAGNFGVPKSDDNGVAIVVNADGILKNNDPAAGIALTSQDGLIAGTPYTNITILGLDLSAIDATSQAGKIITTNGGAWSCMEGVSGSTPGAVGLDPQTNRVLIGQFTTEGVFSFELNIQLGTPTGGTEQYVAKNPIGNEFKHQGLIYPQTIPNIPPTVSITSPINNSTFNAGDPVTITANANDVDGIVSFVEFFVNGQSIGVDNTAPYSINWTATDGTSTITAKAKDNADSVTTSTAVTVTVSPVGIKNINTLDSYIVYPNPVKDLLILKFNTSCKNSANSFTIFDLNGNLLLHKTFGIVSEKNMECIDMSSFSNGQYIIKLLIDGTISTRKIIKD